MMRGVDLRPAAIVREILRIGELCGTPVYVTFPQIRLVESFHALTKELPAPSLFARVSQIQQ